MGIKAILICLSNGIYYLNMIWISTTDHTTTQNSHRKLVVCAFGLEGKELNALVPQINRLANYGSQVT